MGNDSRLADDVAGAEVPPEIGVFQRENAEQEDEPEKRKDDDRVERERERLGSVACAGSEARLAVFLGFRDVRRHSAYRPEFEKSSEN